MSEEVKVEKSFLDHLEDTLDNHLQGDIDATETSFHDYITLKTHAKLSDDAVDTHIDIPDDIELDLEADDVDVSDINIDDHIA